MTRFTSIAPVGELLAPPARPTRRIELLSESSVNGFGLEAPNPYGSPCNDGPDGVSKFHNARKSFAQKLADTLHAELFLTATSYFGVVRNENGATAPLFTDVFERVHPFSPLPAWTFPANQPDVVFVMLGGSDYAATESAPAGFAAGYRAFATKLRTAYPTAEFIYAVGPQIKNSYPPDQFMRNNVKAIMDSIVAADGADKNQVQVFPENGNPAFEQGCYAHANEALHTSMAATALPWVRAATGWVD
ncbi:MAG: hypothetical protein EOP08_06085 [Proteobacteria bacterium]|nr:MAG: hypothetical protein EOP08_06085 [Pseudomonadota bacterium]